MARTLKMDPKSIRQREYRRRYLARKGGDPVTEQGTGRRLSEKTYVFALSEIDFLHLTYQGKETIIGRLTDAQFRQWFCGVVDAALPQVHSEPAQLILRRARLDCCQYDVIDSCVKYDLLNTLYELQAFRMSGVAFVTEADMTVRPPRGGKKKRAS